MGRFSKAVAENAVLSAMDMVQRWSTTPAILEKGTRRWACKAWVWAKKRISTFRARHRIERVTTSFPLSCSEGHRRLIAKDSTVVDVASALQCRAMGFHRSWPPNSQAQMTSIHGSTFYHTVFLRLSQAREAPFFGCLRVLRDVKRSGGFHAMPSARGFGSIAVFRTKARASQCQT